MFTSNSENPKKSFSSCSPETNEDSLLSGYKNVLYNLIETLQIDQLKSCLPQPVTSEILEYFSGLNLTTEEKRRVSILARFSSNIANRSYPRHPNEIRAVIGAYTAFMTLIDDYCPYMNQRILDFSYNLLNRQPQQHCLFQGTQRILYSLYNYFGKYTCQMIHKCTMDFFGGTFLEFYKDHIIPPREALHFPDYIRYKTGISEVYSHFLFNEWEFPESEYLAVYLPVIPEIRIFFDAGNDVVSFYKENIVGNDRFSQQPPAKPEA
jgi:hypothetical protein